MKRTLTFLFICVTLSVIGMPCVFAQTSTGKVQEMTGTVEVKLPGTESFIAAEVGKPLSQDTVISTGFRSFAIVEIGHTLISVRPLTRLTLTEIQASAETETLNVSLQAGRVRVDVKPPVGLKASTSVSGPEATASVRGTSFEFDTRNLYVDNGVVSFAGNRGQAVLVSGGGNSRIEADAKAVSPMEVKVAGVLPQAPVGSEVAGIMPGAPSVSSDAEFTINVGFYQE